MDWIPGAFEVVCRALCFVGLATVDHLADMTGYSPRAVRDTCLRLRDGGYACSVACGRGNVRAWHLTPNGAALIADDRKLDERPYRRAFRRKNWEQTSRHDVAVADVFAHVAKHSIPGRLGIQVSDYSAGPLAGQRFAETSRHPLRPDAWFNLGVDDNVIHAQLELDTGTENLDVIYRKARRYLWTSQHMPNPTNVILITQGQWRRAANILAEFDAKLSTSRNLTPWVTTLDHFLAHSPWETTLHNIQNQAVALQDLPAEKYRFAYASGEWILGERWPDGWRDQSGRWLKKSERQEILPPGEVVAG